MFIPLRKIVWHFEPFCFVYVMGTGISADILYLFPYPARWLRICSYIVFAIACLLLVFLQLFAIIHMVLYSKKHSFKQYFNHYYRNLLHNVFWGTYPMGLVTIINYMTNLTQHQDMSAGNARRLMIFIYILWWYDVAVSILTAWGISFLIWQDYYYTEDQTIQNAIDVDRQKIATKNLKSILLLNVIPLIVATSCGALFTMTELFAKTFNRNIQLLTMVITAILWFHAIVFVAILITIFFWNLYVNKLPKMQQVFTLFLVLGPLGQGSFGILLITDNIQLYVRKYYPLIDNGNLSIESNILTIVVPWCFKVIGLLLALTLLAMGYFFTIISFMSIASYMNTQETNANGKKVKLYNFHKGYWAMTFPLGTMALGSNELYIQYNKYVPLGAFRVVSTIYSVMCVLWSIYCLAGLTYTTIFPFIRSQISNYKLHKDTDTLSNTTKNAIEATLSNGTTVDSDLEGRLLDYNNISPIDGDGRETDSDIMLFASTA